MQRTIRIQLQPDEETIKVLTQTIEQYTWSFNAICRLGWDNKVTNGVALHKETYSNFERDGCKFRLGYFSTQNDTRQKLLSIPQHPLQTLQHSMLLVNQTVLVVLTNFLLVVMYGLL